MGRGPANDRVVCDEYTKNYRQEILLNKFNGKNKYIVDYLMDEVFNIQEIRVRAFLKETSVLKSFNEGLCNTVIGLDCSKKIIEQLEREPFHNTIGQ